MNIAEITTGPIGSVAELVDLEESLEDQAAREQRRWAYRGQPRDYGSLVPSFQREFTRQSRRTAEGIERNLIDMFREHYSSLPDRTATMPLPVQISYGFDLRCLSVMQHYEIPTRLLDWTSSFWTAVYFACTSQSGHRAEFWYYDRAVFDIQRNLDPQLASLIDRSASPQPEPVLLTRRGEGLIVELDPLITPRMEKQAAHHTFSTDVFSDHAPLLFALHQRSAESGAPIPFRRVLVDAACKGNVVQYLAQQKKITAGTIFPDVVGLGRYLRWQFDSLRTMLL
jgi:hypothetical protein